LTQYEFHPEAAIDLDEIWDFIVEDSLDAADKVTGDILDAVESLVSFPRQGRRRPDLTGCPLRFAQVRDYLIAYAPDKTPLWIVAVMQRPAQPPCDGRDP
jgi:plasmid stabilization system protein ParE